MEIGDKRRARWCLRPLTRSSLWMPEFSSTGLASCFSQALTSWSLISVKIFVVRLKWLFSSCKVCVNSFSSADDVPRDDWELWERLAAVDGASVWELVDVCPADEKLISAVEEQGRTTLPRRWTQTSATRRNATNVDYAAHWLWLDYSSNPSLRQRERATELAANEREHQVDLCREREKRREQHHPSIISLEEQAGLVVIKSTSLPATERANERAFRLDIREKLSALRH